MTLNIGDTNRNGLIQVVDTNWDSNGTLRVTVREMIGGGYSAWIGGRPKVMRAMRDTARRALSKPERTRHTRLVREFYAGGCAHATFAVSRNE